MSLIEDAPRIPLKYIDGDHQGCEHPRLAETPGGRKVILVDPDSPMGMLAAGNAYRDKDGGMYIEQSVREVARAGGPAMVNSERFQEGWEQVFGVRSQTGQA